MTDTWIDLKALKAELESFFAIEKPELNKFGSTVNQTFEAFVFAQTISWYKSRPGWTVILVQPVDEDVDQQIVRLKFSTRGRPGGYTYARCESGDGAVVQIRHQLRVATRHHRDDYQRPANICLDVAIIRDQDLSGFTTNTWLPNGDLISFGEAKHMSAFAELVAGFIGLVHELQPNRLRQIRTGGRSTITPGHPSPFLFVSGKLWYTAEGLAETIRRRKYDLDIYDRTTTLAETFALPIMPAPAKAKKKKASAPSSPDA